MPERLLHVSIGYPVKDHVDLLRDSSIYHNCKFIFLPRFWPISESFGVVNKITVLKSWLDSGAVDLSQIIMFTDAYDTILVEDSAQILEKFYSFEADLVFSGEAHFWPPQGREKAKEQFEISTSKWRYLNSGGYIGFAWAIKAMINYCMERALSGNLDFHIPDDQALIQCFFLEHRNSAEYKMILDTEALIFASLNTSLHDFSLNYGRVVNRHTRKTTSILHANADKSNIVVLEQFWKMIDGPSQNFRAWNFKLICNELGYLNYDMETKKMFISENFDGMTLVVLPRGCKQAVGFIPKLGVATFMPGHIVHSDARKIAAYEILTLVNLDVITHHGSQINMYLSDQNECSLQLVDIPLAFLRHESFTDLLNHVSSYFGTG